MGQGNVQLAVKAAAEAAVEAAGWTKSLRQNFNDSCQIFDQGGASNFWLLWNSFDQPTPLAAATQGARAAGCGHAPLPGALNSHARWP